MRKSFLIMSASLLLLGCNRVPPPVMTPLPDEGVGNVYRAYRTVEIEGCEYLLVHGYREESLTHKGNCKNPIHPENRL